MILAAVALATCSSGNRAVQTLDGAWEITADDPSSPDAQWRSIEVPAAFETALGTSFDGVATYRRRFTIDAGLAGERLLLHFDAVATETQVALNGVSLGSHLGGWTPFRFDVSDHVHRAGENVLLVRVDEKVGHNTQGFLPIIAPHFGGIWQSVSLLGVGKGWIDDLSLLAYGDPRASEVVIELEQRGAVDGATYEATVAIGERSFTAASEVPSLSIPVEGFERWSFGAPTLYPLVLRLLDRGGEEVDRVEAQVSFRDIRADGRTLLLNDRPLQVRGLLEWGYYPPLLAPAPSDELVRREIVEARARGFNLIKFCLWLPPRRILSLLDEEGMLAWIEYPTWHPRFDEEHRAELVREFEEFFRHDRNHPCVVARSLTCETGPSASFEVVRDLYERAHRAIPGALVEDDSSWIEWNRVHDFYDDHPYGNNDSWPGTLDRLNEYIDAREAKPLLLGEAIAADTWLDLELANKPDAWWTRRCAADQARWEASMRERFGDDCIDRLERDSLRFALNERKDQIETFRLLVPEGGYVVSVARDFPLATMGLADSRNEWKWSAEDWSWHGDTMLLLERDASRSFAPGSHSLQVFAAHHGPRLIESAALDVSRHDAEFEAFVDLECPDPLVPGTVGLRGEVQFTLGGGVSSEAPRELRLRLSNRDGELAENRWTLWTVPEPQPIPAEVLVVDRLNLDVLAKLSAGARVLHLATNEPGSFTVRPHWFLRGAPWFPSHPLNDAVQEELYLDLLVKDLHPKGLLPVASIFERIDPIIAFWDTHDLAEVRDWAIAFETRVGEGRLLVSALRHEGNDAGEWLRSLFARHLAHGPPPRSALDAEDVAAIEQRLGAKLLPLTEREWEFRPEPDGADAAAWSPIRVGQHWEGQGFDALDGWARYRLRFELADDWLGEPLYLHFDGVDDAFELFFDGELVATGGDIAQRLTAFDERSSHLLAERASRGTHTLEVRVLDWLGAGGIHRPVTLATRPLSSAAEYVNG